MGTSTDATVGNLITPASLTSDTLMSNEDMVRQQLLNLDTSVDRRTQAVLTMQAFLVAAAIATLGINQMEAKYLLVLVWGLGLIVSIGWLLVQAKTVKWMQILRLFLRKTNDQVFVKIYQERKDLPRFYRWYSVHRLQGVYLPAVIILFWSLVGPIIPFSSFRSIW
jgi:hypothetical protein